MKTILCLMLILGLGCARGPYTVAHGDSSASLKTGVIVTTTTTTTAPDGTVTTVVEERCENCRQEEAVGGQGSADLYKMMATIFSAFIGVASIVIQAVN